MGDYMLEEYGENLLRYFELLRNVGGTKALEPYRFLVIGFIDDLFNSGMSEYITECDYKAIDRLLNCWMGSCLMPFHIWKQHKYVRCIPLRLEHLDLFYVTEDGKGMLITE